MVLVFGGVCGLYLCFFSFRSFNTIVYCDEKSLNMKNYKKQTQKRSESQLNG